MAYTSATFGATANCAQDFMAALDPLIRAGGFTFVEAFTNSTDITNVYKSPAASNGVQDWYLYMRRISAASPNVYFTVSEAWDATGKKIQKYCFGNQTSLAPNTAANYTINDATGQTPAGGSLNYLSVNTNTTGHQYWLSVNANRLVVATRIGTSDYAIYAGLLDELLPGTVPGAGVECCVGQFAATGTANPTWYFTREPGQGVVNSGNFGGTFYQTSFQWGWGSPGGVADTVYTNKAYVCRAVVGSCRGVSTAPRGLPKDILSTQFPGTAVNGDTITFGAKTYTRMGSGTGALCNFFVDQAM